MDIFALTPIVEASEKTIQWINTTGLRVVLILLAAWIVRRIVTLVIHTLLRRAVHLEQAVGVDMDREKRMQTFGALISAVLSVAIWIMAALLALQEVGINTGPLLAGAGVLGVGLAFGTQSLVKDFVTGLFIALENQYRVGDQVELDTTHGIVEHLGIRTTVLRDDEGNIHFVPNGSIIRTVNKSMGFTELNLQLITTHSEKDDIRKLVASVGQKMQAEKQWRPQFTRAFDVRTTVNATGKTLEYIISGNVKNAYHEEARKEFTKRLKEKLAAKNITVKKLVKYEEPSEEAKEVKKDETK